MKSLKKIFLIGKIEEGSFRYVGTNIVQKNNCILIDQDHYAEGIDAIDMTNYKHLDNEAVLDKHGQALYRSKVGGLNWLAIQTRPDIAFDVMQLSTYFGTAKVKHLKEVNKCIKVVKHEKVTIRYPKLKDQDSWKIVSLGDGAHANLPDKVSSSGGHIVFLMDKNGNSCPLSWAVNKIQRVVRSSLAAEAMTMQDAVENAMFIKAMLIDILGCERKLELKIELVTDNKSLTEAIYRNTQVSDKRLRIDIAALKQEVEEGDVLVTWVPGSRMLADVLSKKGVKKDLLNSILRSGKILVDGV